MVHLWVQAPEKSINKVGSGMFDALSEPDESVVKEIPKDCVDMSSGFVRLM